jgi:hypothetical protein
VRALILDDRVGAACGAQPSKIALAGVSVSQAQFKLTALYEYGRRRAADGGDAFFVDSGMVSSFLSCGEVQMD